MRVIQRRDGSGIVNRNRCARNRAEVRDAVNRAGIADCRSAPGRDGSRSSVIDAIGGSGNQAAFVGNCEARSGRDASAIGDAKFGACSTNRLPGSIYNHIAGAGVTQQR